MPLPAMSGPEPGPRRFLTAMPLDVWRECLSPLRFSQGRAQILRCAQDDKTAGCHPFASLRAGSERSLRVWRDGRRSFAALRMTGRTALKSSDEVGKSYTSYGKSSLQTSGKFLAPLTACQEKTMLKV